MDFKNDIIDIESISDPVKQKNMKLLHIVKAVQYSSELIQELQRKLEEKDDTIEQQSEQLALDAPKVNAYNEFLDSDGLFDMKIVANSMDYGRTKFMRLLRINNILNSDNLPYQKYLNPEYFKIKTITINGTSQQFTKVTPKGMDWLYKKIQEIEYKQL